MLKIDQLKLKIILNKFHWNNLTLMNTHILIAPHRLATTRFNSSRTTFTLLRTITSHFICGFFVALFSLGNKT
jgi:hypothetical protein